MAKHKSIAKAFGMRCFSATDGELSAKKAEGFQELKARTCVIASYGVEVTAKKVFARLERAELVKFKADKTGTVEDTHKGAKRVRECVVMTATVREAGNKFGETGDMVAVIVKGSKQVQSATCNRKLHGRLNGKDKSYDLEGDATKHYAGFVKITGDK